MCKRFIHMLLCFVLLLTIVLPVYAVQAEESEDLPVVELKISTAEEFIIFAENCRLDSYSQNLKVILTNDIDLSELSFEPVPIFSGSFDGKGHTVSGLTISADGSVQGLFRYLTDAALVQNLCIDGEIRPGGSGNEVGAVSGQNEGRILNCTFRGNLSGCDRVGGIAGINTASGIIEDCQVTGEIHGDHFVGGIAGENHGVIRSCSNQAQINTTPQQNDVELSDISLDSLTNTEAANTITDIGGIAGISIGVIRECQNRGDVGYQHMGYNIGGIAGTQSGYITSCENLGSIQGRKEVGGIVGQMEPASVIEYSEDTLQILQSQLGTMSGLVNRASGNAQANAGKIANQIGVLQYQTQTARGALESLIPKDDNPELPDPDTILAAQNTLSASLKAMPGTLRNIGTAAQSTVSGLTRDLNAISAQINAMGNTISGASENLGGTITDVSDLDTPDILTGKVESCKNHGPVLADLNIGGIAGAMAVENDLDILEDWELLGEESLNFDSEVRTVVLNCENCGILTGKKQNVGGIAGWQSLGLVKDSCNTGRINAESADYVGGISGLSTGYIRNNYAKCEIDADTYIGGIAGSATVTTDCISMVHIIDGKEKLGAILGYWEESRTQEEETPVCRNIYPLIPPDIGAIDGISYAQLAEPIALDTFLANEDIPEMFKSVKMRFLFDDETETVITLLPGDSLPADQIPAIPQKDGFTSSWEYPENFDLEQVLFDKTVQLHHTPNRTTIQSEQTRDGKLPLLLAEGFFSDTAAISISTTDATPELSEKEILVEAWSIQAAEGTTKVRLLLPDGAAADKLKVLVCREDSVWSHIGFTQDGSYLVIPLDAGNMHLALVQDNASPAPLLFAGIGVFIILLIVIIVLRRNQSKKQRRMDTQTQ